MLGAKGNAGDAGKNWAKLDNPQLSFFKYLCQRIKYIYRKDINMARKKTQEEFEKDVYDRLGDQYEILGSYPGGHGKVPMRHLVCGNTFDKNVHDIISKSSGCPYCNGSRPKLYNEKWVKDNTPLPYHYVSGY